MLRLTCVLLVTFAAVALADEPLPRIPPKEPDDALKTFVVRDGFEMQLIAAEPLVASPVAMEYDENGRAYVAEMRDYPYTHKASDKPFTERTTDELLGRVRLLEDTDGDGRFDKSTIFAEGLSWPTGLALWKGGVYVVATPDLWYLKDSDGDGKADVRRKVFTGFRKFNVQAVINNLKWGLDGRIYGAGSSNGGQIRKGDDPSVTPVVMPTADFRFDPREEKFELISGGARFGNTFDDWGNRFICNIRNPIQHVVLPREYLARNPHWPARSALHDVAEAGDTLPVFRISPPEPWRVLNARRLSSDATIASPRSETVATGYMTSASGLTIYRGDAYPAELYGSVFLGEVAGNLIHHQILTPRGVTFTATRSSPHPPRGGGSRDSAQLDSKSDSAQDPKSDSAQVVQNPASHRGKPGGVANQSRDKPAEEEEPPQEFVASTDNWFRPVNFVNAPDGTLHVLDMYRETIEHPWSIPDDIKTQLDLESGRDRGRIYRLAPIGFKPPKPPRLHDMTTPSLVQQLENPNVWWRETAHRLLIERDNRQTIDLLQSMGNTTNEKVINGRDATTYSTLHSLWLLQHFHALRDINLLHASLNPTARIREQAVRLAEPTLKMDAGIRDLVCKRADDVDVRVRFQVAFSLGSATRHDDGSPDEAVIAALARIAWRDRGDEFIRTAVLSSSADVAPRLLRAFTETQSRERSRLVPQGAAPASEQGDNATTEDRFSRDLAFVIGARAKTDELEQLFDLLAGWPNELDTKRLVAEIAVGFGDGLKRANKALSVLLAATPHAGAKRLQQAIESALAVIADPQAAPVDRQHAGPLLAFVEFDQAKRALAPLLQRSQSAASQGLAVRTLAAHRNADVPALLLSAIRELAPGPRGEAIEALLSRPDAHVALLEAVQSGEIAFSDIPHVRRNLLVRSSNSAVKERAVALFTTALASRQKAVDKYRSALPSLPGDRTKGEIVFRRDCMACHRVGDVGTEIGPNLRTIRHRAAEEVLLQILDPNREVGPNYVAYAVVTDEGRVIVGLIVEETAHSITLLRPIGTRETILRANIEELAALGKSLMPEGLEEKIMPQEMTDLLEWLLK